MVLYVRHFLSLVSQSTKFITIRHMNTVCMTDTVKSLLYKEYGEPVNVLQITKEAMNKPDKYQVYVHIYFHSYITYIHTYILPICMGIYIL